MSFLAHLDSLRAHGEWADQRLVKAVRDAAAPVAVLELAHVRGAQETWLSRIEQRSPSLPVWPELSVEELVSVGASMDSAWRARFSELTERMLGLPVSYRNLAGAPHTTPLSEILLHTFLHGQYHRGKASVALRAATGAAVSVDYMLWQWSGAPRA